jgi:hypothetical protein
MHIVIDNLSSLPQLLSCLMAVVSEQNRLLRRSLSLSRVFAASSLWVCGAEKLLTILSFSCFQLEMEDGDEIDAMLHQTGGTTA